jgi:hypothetical protein
MAESFVARYMVVDDMAVRETEIVCFAGQGPFTDCSIRALARAWRNPGPPSLIRCEAADD